MSSNRCVSETDRLAGDTMTTPTPAMLEAVQSCTLLDDVFVEDPTTMDLEAHCAELSGKEAGLFVLSGTMGNQLALRSLLTQPPHAVLADHRSHIVCYEAGGFVIKRDLPLKLHVLTHTSVSSLTGATVKTVVPKNGTHLTLEDVKANVQLDDGNVHYCPTRVISLENTLNGMVMPLDEVKKISEFAREHGIKMHCDGARLWEAVASGAGSLVDFCAHFDTISLCFSKGLGAPVGSMLVGNAATIRHARWVRKSIGGGLRQPGPLTAAARVAVDVTFGKGPNGEGGLLKNTHVLAKQVEKLWTDLGGKVLHPVHTNMCWLDLEASGISGDTVTELGATEGLKLMGNRFVIHYQIYQNREEVMPRLKRVFEKAMSSGKTDSTESSKRKAHGENGMYTTSKKRRSG